MTDADATPGARLRSARLRAGFVQADRFAEGMGIKPVTYRAYENDQNGYAKHAHRFAAALGVTSEWLLDGQDSGGVVKTRPASNAQPFQMEGAPERRMRDDLPIFGSALGSPKQVDGEAIEQFSLNTGEVIQYARRPVILEGQTDAYGLYVQGHSMEPVHLHADLILAETRRPARIGDDVVVYLRPDNPEDDDGDRARAVLVKRLVRRTSSVVELEQFNPARIFQLPVTDVVRIDRVLRLADLIA